MNMHGKLIDGDVSLFTWRAPVFSAEDCQSPDTRIEP